MSDEAKAVPPTLAEVEEAVTGLFGGSAGIRGSGQLIWMRSTGEEIRVKESVPPEIWYTSREPIHSALGKAYLNALPAGPEFRVPREFRDWLAEQPQGDCLNCCPIRNEDLLYRVLNLLRDAGFGNGEPINRPKGGPPSA